MADRKVNKNSKTNIRKTPRVKKSLTAPRSQDSSALVNYFRLGESYTSLVMGIVVVIVVAILLASLFKTRNSSSQIDDQKGATSISTIAKQLNETPISSPTKYQKPSPSPVQAQGVISTQEAGQSKQSKEVTYEVKAGDDLWKIAVEQYHDGYKWVDIARANHLTNPGIINVGNVLILPEVALINAQIAQNSNIQPVKSEQKIVGESYKIVHGDDLWSIAQKAYGNGYKWVDIAKANKLAENPDLIHAGNTLKIPR